MSQPNFNIALKIAACDYDCQNSYAAAGEASTVAVRLVYVAPT